MTLADPVSVPAEVLRPHRTMGGWVSPRGINTDLVPWRLWEKAKKHFWDPADINFEADAAQWAATPLEYQDAVMATATGFIVGEEAVTLDILPLSIAMADEGRLEEVIYLSSFALEEAKHVDFFRRWLTAVGADLDGYRARQQEKARRLGLPFDYERSVGMWESELPRVMRRLLVDRSAHAVLDAALTYNQFIEGCLAISGYGLWHDLFATLNAFPAMQEGIRHIRADEGRHITYGTFLCQRVLAANPDLIDFARERMHELHGVWFTTFPTVDDPADPVATEQGKKFRALVDDQIVRRIAVMERAAQMSEEELITSSAAEDAERELIGAE